MSSGVARERPYVDTAKAVHHRLDRLDADGPEPDPTEGRRPAIAEHADGSQLASSQLPVLRGHEDLTDPGVGPGAGELGSGAVISAARARWPACDGQVTRIVIGPGGMPLDHGRSMRLVPPDVRRAAEVRDGGRVFAGCAAPKHWCGPPRLPRRTTTRRAMAHPAP